MTEEGIHPHPGPPPSLVEPEDSDYIAFRTRKKNHRGRKSQQIVRIRFADVNVQCGSGVWRAFALLKDSKDLMVFQETKMKESEATAFIRYANKHDFQVYHQPGPQSALAHSKDGTSRENGGVMIIVRKTLQQRELRKVKEHRYQFVLLAVAGWMVLGGYVPSAAEENSFAAQTIREIAEDRTWENKDLRWLVVGDFNDEPDESPIRAVLERSGGNQVPIEATESHRATRWDGDREIDWMITSDIAQVSQIYFAGEAIADHKILCCELTSPHTAVMERIELQKKPVYKRPSSLSAKEWKDVFEDVWRCQEHDQAQK